jgi:integrase
MSVYKDKKTGKWFVYICHNRTRYRKKSPDNTRTGAVAYEALLRGKLTRGEPIENETKEKRQAFQDFAWEWFNIYVKNNNKISEIRGKMFTLKTHLVPFFGKTQIDKLSGLQIERYKAKKINEGLTNKTINNHLAVLNKCLLTAQEWLELDKIPKIKKLKVPPQKYDYLTVEESRSLLRHTSGMWRDIVLVALKTGLRLGELRGLKWKDISWEKRELTVRRSVYLDKHIVPPKSNKERIVPLSDDAYLILSQNRREKGFIFSIKPGIHLKNTCCRKRLYKMCDAAGLRRIGWHVLRHTFASQLVMAGAHLKAVQELLGHTDIQTTMRYAHMSPSTLSETVKLLDTGSANNNLRQYSASKGEKFAQILESIASHEPVFSSKVKQKQDPKALFV